MKNSGIFYIYAKFICVGNAKISLNIFFYGRKWTLRLRRLFAWCCVIFCLASCNTTQFLGEGEKLLIGNQIKFHEAKEIKNKRSLKYQLSTLYKQEENSNFLFIPREWFYYKTQKPEDTTRFDRWKLRFLGEEPAVFSTAATKATLESINFYMRYKGYYNASVYVDSVFSKNEKKVSLTYHVTPGPLFTIDTVIFRSGDAEIEAILQKIKDRTHLKEGRALDREHYEDEKKRVLRYLRNHGYAQFYPNYFAPLEADSTINIERLPRPKNKKVSLDFIVNRPYQDSAHQKFVVGEVLVYPQFDPVRSPAELVETTIEKCRFLAPQSEEKYRINPQIIRDAIFLQPGEFYSQDDYDKTNRQLTKLGVFKFVRIHQEVDSLQPDKMNFRIELPRIPRLQLGMDFELNYTNRSGGPSSSTNLLGIALNPSFRSRNLFHGAELLVGNLYAGVEVNPNVRKENRGDFWNTVDLGVQMELYFPRFLDHLGFWKTSHAISKTFFGRKENEGLYPQLKDKAATRLGASYNFIKLLNFYDYNLLNASYGYDLQKDNHTRHIINHFGVDFLNVDTTQRNFKDILAVNPFLKASFGDQLLVSLLFREFNYIYTSPVNRSDESHYIGVSFETAGAEIWGVNQLYNRIADTTAIFRLKGKNDDINFSQYFRLELDLRFNKRLTPKRSYAARFNIGVARPFGNTDDVPYVKQFYVGGPNSIRAWAARGLGPGGFTDVLTQEASANRLFFSQAGDFKLEFNLEYRFNIFWLLDGALFLDGGNIWTLRPDNSRCGSQFLLKPRIQQACEGNMGDKDFYNEAFYKQIALGGGFGARLDFTYFILRLDAGIRLRYPDPNALNPLTHKSYSGYWNSFPGVFLTNHVNFNLGLGYPF